MPSDRHLHPLSILFGLARPLRQFAIPGLLLLFTAGRSGWGWGVLTLVLFLPGTIVSIVRYLTFTYRCEPGEMVIRSGILFRNERHIPWSRIQNLDAVQGPLHRLLGVADVRVQTGAGNEPEATMSVLPLDALEDLRRRVRLGQGIPRDAVPDAAPPGEAPIAAAEPSRTLLHLGTGEILLCGVIDSRGLVVMGAAAALLSELGLLDRVTDALFGGVEIQGVLGQAAWTLFGGRGASPRELALVTGVLAGLFLLTRVLSAGRSMVRLHGYRLTRSGDDLRAEFGLLTRVSATIPLRRIQAVTVQSGPLHRLFGRCAVRVETAGGGAGKSGGAGSSGGSGGGGDDQLAAQRRWLAPIVRRDALPALLAELLPGLDFEKVEWNAAHPGAFRRAVKVRSVMALAAGLAFVVLLGWWDIALIALLLALAVAASRGWVSRLGWAVPDGVVLFRSGWLRQNASAVPLSKIQAVTLLESPFDRRARMSSLSVDTAGTGAASHRVNIPYLTRETARELHEFLSARAAQSDFRW